MDKFTERVGKSLGRHFVSLSCVQHPPESEAMRVHVFSGFIVDIAGEWFYVTAGHILRDIRLAQEAGSTFDIWRLGDQTAGNKFNDTAVPYGFDLTSWFVLEDQQAGLDYATVHLGGLYRQQLEAGGVAALARNAWSDHLAEHDHWVLVGIPTETVAYDGKTIILAKFVMTPLHPSDAPPLAEQKVLNKFYAKLADESENFVSNVVGMSGGPVFELKNTNDVWKYSVIGVQSGWYPNARIVAVCPFSTFGLALEDVVNEALHSLKEAENGPLA